MPVVGVTVRQVDGTQEGVDAGAHGRAEDEVVEAGFGAGSPDVARLDPAAHVDAMAEPPGQPSRSGVVAQTRHAEQRPAELTFLESRKGAEPSQPEVVVEGDVGAEVRASLESHVEPMPSP